jgi:molybdopterin molybdotransferase
MIDLEKAFSIIDSIQPLNRTEEADISRACGRVLASELFAPFDSPPFNKSAMDGFVIQADDDAEKFEIIETVAAGSVAEKKLTKSCCARIMTGAALPAGAARVIRFEYAEEKNGFMRVVKEESSPNIIFKGENIKKGSLLLEKKRIGPVECAVLASAGIRHVKVQKKIQTGIISTGTELAEPGTELKPGQIYNSNGYQLEAQALSAGCMVNNYGIVEDDKAALGSVVSRALEADDLIIISGGVSEGDFDFIPELLEEKGAEVLFYKVAVKPGKPVLLCRKDTKLIIGLPGNPVSTFIMFEIFIKAVISKLYGLEYKPFISRAKLLHQLARKAADRTEFIPVLCENGTVRGLNYKGSADINSLAAANGLVVMEKGVCELPEGELVYVRQI